MVQTVTITLMGPSGARIFEVSATDNAYTEVTSKTGTNSLHDVMKGQFVKFYRGEFAAAEGYWRVRNTASKTIKAIQLLDQLGETRTREIQKPFVVEDNDILECYVNTA